MFPTLWNIDFCACNFCDWVGCTLLSQNRARLRGNAFSADCTFTLHDSLAVAGPSLEETASSWVLPLIGHIASKLKLLHDKFGIFFSKHTGSSATSHTTPICFPLTLLNSAVFFFLPNKFTLMQNICYWLIIVCGSCETLPIYCAVFIKLGCQQGTERAS